jgi:hypothetical protein
MNTTRSNRRRGGRVAEAAVLMASAGAASACTPSSGAAQGASTLSVVVPDAGAAVSLPFTVTVATGEPLGESDTGRHHIHIWYDGNEDQYQISYVENAQVTDAPAGAHTMTVSLRNADHSDAGPRVDVPLTIGGTPASDTPALETGNPNGY